MSRHRVVWRLQSDLVKTSQAIAEQEEPWKGIPIDLQENHHYCLSQIFQSNYVGTI